MNNHVAEGSGEPKDSLYTLGEDLYSKGLLSYPDFEGFKRSSDSSPLLESLKIFTQIEVYFWSILCSVVGGYAYLSNQGNHERDFSNLFGSASVFATTLRGTISYLLAKRQKMNDADIFALIEIIPYIGRLAPLLWLPEHRTYITLFLLSKKYKNPKEISETEYLQFRTHVEKMLKILLSIRTILETIREKSARVTNTLHAHSYVHETLIPLSYHTFRM